MLQQPAWGNSNPKYDTSPTSYNLGGSQAKYFASRGPVSVSPNGSYYSVPLLEGYLALLSDLPKRKREKFSSSPDSGLSGSLTPQLLDRFRVAFAFVKSHHRDRISKTIETFVLVLKVEKC